MAEGLARVSALGAIAGTGASGASGAANVLFVGDLQFFVIADIAMIELREGNEPEPRTRARAGEVFGVTLPQSPNTAAPAHAGAALWLGPDHWLLVAQGAPWWPTSWDIDGFTFTEMSHARVGIRMTGTRTRCVLAKGCMLDLHPGVFVCGACAQTSIAGMPVIIHRREGNDAFDIYVSRSYAKCFWSWLAAAAMEYGYHVASALTD